MHCRLADDCLTTKLITNEPIKELEDVTEENLAWTSAATQGNTDVHASFFSQVQLKLSKSLDNSENPVMSWCHNREKRK